MKKQIYLILHCYEIAKRNSLNQSIVYSPDMDVFLLLIFHYPSLPNALIFHIGKRPNLSDISIGSCHKALGFCNAHALLGFHTFAGFDQTGCFM